MLKVLTWPNGYSSKRSMILQICNRIKVDCTCVHIPCLPQWRRHWDATVVTTSIFLPLNTTSWCSPFLARTLDPPPYSIDLPPFLFQLQQLQEQQFCPNMSQQVSINITRVSHRTLHPHHAQDEGFHHTDDHLNTSGNLVLQAIPFSQRGKDFFFSVRTMRS